MISTITLSLYHMDTYHYVTAEINIFKSTIFNISLTGLMGLYLESTGSDITFNYNNKIPHIHEKIRNGIFAHLCWYCSSWIIQHFKQWFFFLFFIRIIYCFFCSLFIWLLGLCLFWFFCFLLTVNLMYKKYYPMQALKHVYIKCDVLQLLPLTRCHNNYVHFTCIT